MSAAASLRSIPAASAAVLTADDAWGIAVMGSWLKEMLMVSAEIKGTVGTSCVPSS